MNQLLDGSISLSPLYPNLKINLHVRIHSNLHQSFPWLRPIQAQFTIFRVPPYMLILESCIRELRSADVDTIASFTPLTFITHIGLTPYYSHKGQTPWSVFQDGTERKGIREKCTTDVNSNNHTPNSSQRRINNTLKENHTFNFETFHLCLTSLRFQVLFTLFSKFFSSFPHGTCSLSVAVQYLALDRGRPGFRQGFSCPAVLRILLETDSFRIRGFHAL